MAALIAACSPFRGSGTSPTRCRVRTAIIPQPMSTPTAAGMIAPERRDHATHRRALAQVRIGHQREVRVDERHAARQMSLLSRLVAEDRRPVHQPLADLLHLTSPDQVEPVPTAGLEPAPDGFVDRCPILLGDVGWTRERPPTAAQPTAS